MSSCKKIDYNKKKVTKPKIIFETASKLIMNNPLNVIIKYGYLARY